MTKVVAFDLSGKEVAKASRSSGTIVSEVTIETDLYRAWDNVAQCIREVTERISRESLGTISAVGITATGDGTWMLDKTNQPVCRGIMWCDGRAQEYVDRWYADGTAREIYRLSGNSVFTGTQSVQIKWLEDHDPDTLNRAHTIFHHKDWIFFNLTGVISSDQSDESLINIDHRTWEYSRELLQLQQIEKYLDRFPLVRPTRRNCDPIRTEVAQDLGLPANVPIVAGPQDVPANALGVGAVNNGQASTVLGTAGLHQIVMDDPNISESNMTGMTICHAIEGMWVRLNASMFATPNLDWTLKLFGLGSPSAVNYAGLEEELGKLQPGSGGVVFHPYLNPGGERAPFVNTSAKGSFTGLDHNHTRYNLIRAVYEGVAFSTRHCYEHMPLEPYEILLSGGGATSNFWCQIIADVMDKPVIVTEGSEYGARGAAMNAGVAATVFGSYEEAKKEMVHRARAFDPNTENVEQYQPYYGLYTDLYEKQIEPWKVRAEILRRERQKAAKGTDYGHSR